MTRKQRKNKKKKEQRKKRRDRKKEDTQTSEPKPNAQRQSEQTQKPKEDEEIKVCDLKRTLTPIEATPANKRGKRVAAEAEALVVEEVDTIMMQDISNSLTNTPNRANKGEGGPVKVESVAESGPDKENSGSELINSPKKAALEDSLSAEAVTPVYASGAPKRTHSEGFKELLRSPEEEAL